MSKNELVLTQNDKIFTTSKILAEGFGIEHRALKNSILKYKKQLETFGPVTRFKEELETDLKIPFPNSGNRGGGRREDIYLLNKKQAMLVLNFSRNSEEVVLFKIELIDRFFEMEKTLKMKYIQATAQVTVGTRDQLRMLKNISEEMKIIYSGVNDAEKCKNERVLYLDKILQSVIIQSDVILLNNEMIEKDRIQIDTSFEEEIPMLEEDLDCKDHSL